MERSVDLIILLAKSVANNRLCLNISTPSDVDKVLDRHGPPATFLWVKCEDRPIYQFWRLFKEGMLAPNCHVVFTDTKIVDPGWADLETTFGGTKFGSLFLMRVCGNVKPPILPSQHGLYKK